MASELQPLSLLFQNRFFRIPDYQRGYAWQEAHLADFWDDITNLQQDRYHYTGLLSLKSLSRNETQRWGSDAWLMDKGFKPCHIVDGQQRLTTFVILLNEMVCFVRDVDENKGKDDGEIVLGYDELKDVVAKYIRQSKPPLHHITTYLFGYEVDNPSADYLRYRIFGEPHAGTVNETYYTKNLKFAKEFFRKNLAVLYQEEGLPGISDLYLKLTLRLMFNIHEIDDDYDVFVAFETMNNRGKKLTNLELLKNRLIYLTTLYSEDAYDTLEKDYLRKLINDAWKEVYFQLGRNEKRPLSDDEFLRAHWTIYFMYSRKRGSDYVQFLLNKFSAKNIFEKKTVLLGDLLAELESSDYEEEDDAVDEPEVEATEVSMLSPTEIADYVKSLKGLAKYWYDTFFPIHSKHLSKQEQVWVDKLIRIGIGYFRPLVTVIISKRHLTAEARIAAFQAIERFIFICFRLGNYNASYLSSVYYRAARSLYYDEVTLEALTQRMQKTTDENVAFAIPNFITRIEKYFSSKGGYYQWNALRYFLYEYEKSLALKNNIDRSDSWEMFSNSDKDKVSIEHILPQVPTKHYWRNAYRQFSEREVEVLAGALGNLLPLSQSINASMQNDSFPEKKSSSKRPNRGYENGSHSEIEVSKLEDWTAKDIYARSKALLGFMESRWGFSFEAEQLDKLIRVGFAMDGRDVPPEILEETQDSRSSAQSAKGGAEYSLRDIQNREFWEKFVAYCKANGRMDIAARKPSTQHWYDMSVGARDFHLSFTVTYESRISLVIYLYNLNAFNRLESKKDAINRVFGEGLEWYTSRKNSRAKRIVYKRRAEVYNPDMQAELFSWMIRQYDALMKALVFVGEVPERG